MGGTAVWRKAAGRVGLAAVTLLAVCAGAARAVAPPSPWNGVNPFRCTIQDAGQGTQVPDPGADPYCVRFDKTNQNVTQLGLVTFLTKEPARFGAAAPKCFYYQEDHWRGSVIQSDGQTVLYEFSGHYFFNKATGDGGVWVTGFTLAGQTFDPRSLPGFPPQYDQYYGPGTGGFITHDDIPADPACVAQAQRSPGAVYANHGSACVRARGPIGSRRLGPVKLGMSELRLRAVLGPPASTSHRFLGYCLASGGWLLAGERRHHIVFALTTSRAFALPGQVRVGASTARLRSALPRLWRMRRVRRTTVFGLPESRGSSETIAGVAGGRVVYIAVYDEKAIGTARGLVRYLEQAR